MCNRCVLSFHRPRLYHQFLRRRHSYMRCIYDALQPSTPRPPNRKCTSGYEPEFKRRIEPVKSKHCGIWLVQASSCRKTSPCSQVFFSEHVWFVLTDGHSVSSWTLGQKMQRLRLSATYVPIVCIAIVEYDLKSKNLEVGYGFRVKQANFRLCRINIQP